LVASRAGVDISFAQLAKPIGFVDSNYLHRNYSYADQVRDVSDEKGSIMEAVKKHNGMVENGVSSGCARLTEMLIASRN
jgi:hypothetical protein